MGLHKIRLRTDSSTTSKSKDYYYNNPDLLDSKNMSSQDDEESNSITVEKPSGWGSRHTMALLAFFGFAASYAMRVNLSVAIVAMVNSTGVHDGNPSGDQTVCPELHSPILFQDGDSNRNSTSHILKLSEDDSALYTGEFNWDPNQQGLVLGSFFYGYVVTQVPGGMIAERVGGKWIFGIGMLITALFSLVTPFAARTGMGALIFVRIIQGLGEGVTNPAMHALLARWVPPLERSKFGAYVYAGAQIGTVIAMPLSGVLVTSVYGWPSVFYAFGIFGIIWFIFWSIFVYDSPASHPRISPKELSYIQHSIGGQTSKHKVPTPWKAVLTSMPFYAILVAQTGHGWGLYTLLTELPTFMKSILHFDLKSMGFLSALPYFTMWLVSLVVSWAADFMREADMLSTTSTRKLFNTIAHWGPAISLVAAAYAGCDRVLVLLLLTMAVGINGAHFAAFQVNHIDIAPNHAGVMMGISNGFANLCGIAAPYVAGQILQQNGSNLESWRLIFIIAAVIYFVDNVFYLIFASGEEQPWNRERYNEHTDSDPLLADSSESSSSSSPSLTQHVRRSVTSRGYQRHD